MADSKTQETQIDPMDFIAGLDHPTRKADAIVLDRLFREITGWQPRMWGPTIIGYGQYHYIYESGREGDCLATGFSRRKASLSLYIMPGYQDFGHILERLGKHKIGKACLYINKLADVDINVVAEIIQAGLTDLDTRWSVKPS